MTEKNEKRIKTTEKRFLLSKRKLGEIWRKKTSFRLFQVFEIKKQTPDWDYYM